MPKRTERDLRFDAGQLLIMGFDGVELGPELRAMLAELQPGGVILFARNIQSPSQTWELLRECQKATREPLYRCVDMEGGTVDRLKNVIAPAPAAADVYSSAEGSRARVRRELFRKHGAVIGRECAALGFNVDFAPVFDLGFAPSRKVLTSRTVSEDPKQTILYAREFLRGLGETRVLGCGKHFPGLGEATLDTHKELPSIDKPWKRLWDEDLAPYVALRRQMPFVMVAHAGYPAVTGDNTPASLSKKWITEILRKKIGYNGLVISDDLEMGGVLAAADIGDAAVRTIEAGADIYLVCHQAEAVRSAYEAVVRRAEKDRRFAERVRETAQRIRRAKRKASIGERRVPAPSEAAVNRLRCAIWEFEEEMRAANLKSSDGNDQRPTQAKSRLERGTHKTPALAKVELGRGTRKNPSTPKNPKKKVHE
jgi:beta-N-acetylhexosaminidase